MSIHLPSTSKLTQPSFLFGVATASYQIEGATLLDNRLESIWDRFCSIAGNVKNGDSGKVACDHYHLWEQDIELIKSLEVDAYRLSIAWPRIMDMNGQANPKGIAFYRSIMRTLKENDIQVYVTLYHWDLPQYLEDRGGWVNRETAYAFCNYAALVAKELGAWVDAWTTLNEPFCSSILGYGEGVHAPGLKNPRLARQAAHHLLLGHGLAMSQLRQITPQVKAGIVLNMNRSYPIDDSQSSQFASMMRDALDNQFFIEPILNGEYPAILQRLCSDIMPTVLPGDMDVISHPIDFLGLNYYTCNRNQFDAEHWYKNISMDPTTVEHTDIGWEVCPEGLTELLVQLNKQYKLPPLYITENGAACADVLENGEVHDEQRVRYLNSHLNAVHNAIELGVDIRGYFAWSLMDNFEWAEGYSKRFGLVYVDYETQQRTLKDSAIAFRTFLRSRKTSSAE